MTAIQPSAGGDVAAESAARVAADAAESAARVAADALKAPLASPALTGTPTVPKATSGTNTTQAASTSFVHDAIAAATFAVGSRPSRVYDVIADGGADPTTSAGREIRSIVQTALTAGNSPIFIPPIVAWTIDLSLGALTVPAGMGISGVNGGQSIINGKGSLPVASDMVILNGNGAFAKDLQLSGVANLVTGATSGSFSADPAATGFTLTLASAASFPSSGTGYIVAISSPSNDSAPSLRLTYTAKSGNTLTGCNWDYGEVALWLYKTWTIPSGTSVALYTRGCGVRANGDSQYVNIQNVMVQNTYDGFCFGDDANWHVATVNTTAGSPNVTWVSGSTFPSGNASAGGIVGAQVAIVGAGANSHNGMLGADTDSCTVSTRTDSTHVVLSENATNTTTGATMVWGGSAVSQGGSGGCTFSRMHAFYTQDVGRFSVAGFPNSDHPDLGNMKFGDGRLLSNYGHTGFFWRASGVQSTGDMKVNGHNRGLDHGNGAPGSPGGSATANFNWGDFLTESHAILGVAFSDDLHPTFPCVSTHAGTSVKNLKLQLADSTDKWPLLVGIQAQTIMIDDIYVLQTGGLVEAFANIRGGDSITIGKVRLKGNAAFKRVWMRNSAATNVFLPGPVMISATNFDASTAYLYQMTDDSGATFSAPSASHIEGETLPGGRLPTYYLKTALASAATATAWRFALRQQRGFKLDVYAQLSGASKTLMLHRRIMVTKDTAGGTPTNPSGAGGAYAVTTPTADVGSLTAPTIDVTFATTSPISTAAITILNNDAGSITGKVWGVLDGRVVGIEVAGPGAGLTVTGGTTSHTAMVIG